ncbi:NHL repeat-containing protein [Ramlibacter henchirensis]|nr:NHL repeat-containing protein [Ramlibacter henchirensis]
MTFPAIRACVALASALLLLACGGGSSSPPPVARHFTNFQAASVVIGQPDATSGEPNQGGSTSPHGLSTPGAMILAPQGQLLVSDSGNHRVLLFDALPEVSGASAKAALGQSSLQAGLPFVSDKRLDRPAGVAVGHGKIAVADWGSNRVLIFDQMPLEGTMPAAKVVLGQTGFDDSAPACAANGMDGPNGVIITPLGQLIVVDTNNHRVLVWKQVPETMPAPDPDLVLGQATKAHCVPNDDLQDGTPDTSLGMPIATARTLMSPRDVWSDGRRLVVSDALNNRVLIWTSFPSDSFQPANIVLGHSDFSNTRQNDGDRAGGATPTARTLHHPSGVHSDGTSLAVADVGNHRALIWNTFPSANSASADVVLGQPGFDQVVITDTNLDGIADMPTERNFGAPNRVLMTADSLLVSDGAFNRVMVFRKQ